MLLKINNKAHAITISLSIILCIVVSLIVDVFYKIDFEYTHLFYIPILLTGIWYKRKVIYVAVILGVVNIIFDFYTKNGFTAASFFRMAIFIIVAITLKYLIERKDQFFKELMKTKSAIADFEEREVREKFESFFSNTPIITWITRLSDGKFEAVNNAFENEFGYTAEEAIGKTTLDLNVFLDPNDRERFVTRVKEYGYANNIKINYRKKNGDLFIGLASAKSFYMRNDTFMVGTILDITGETKLEEEYASAIQTTHDSFWLNDMNGSFLQINNAVCDLLGYSRDELLNDMHIYDVEYNATKDSVIEHINQIKENKYHRFEVQLKRKDGKVICTEASASYLPISNCLCVFLRDITEKNQAEKALRISEEKYRALFENATEMIFIISNRNIRICNPISEKITGYSIDELLAMSPFELIYRDDVEKIIDNNQRRQSGELFDNVNVFRIIKKDGTVCWVEMHSVKVDWDNEDATLNFIMDITNKKANDEKIYSLSYHDQLTGLYNRRYYEEEIQKLNADAHFLPLTIIMADVNGLKLANDVFGHKAGDNLLKTISSIFTSVCHEDDLIARIGGDEFAIILPKTDAEAARKIIAQINDAVSGTVLENIVLSVSIGYATKTDFRSGYDDVFKDAEDMMYRNKLTESAQMRRKTIQYIIDSILMKHDRERGHAYRVSHFCEALAKELGFDAIETDKIKKAGLMHDLGKTGIDLETFEKKTELNDEEWADIKRHSEVGYRILSSVEDYSDIARSALEHHEKWDGSGYPNGLKGNEISLQARMIAIADSFDVMTSDHLYANTLTVEEAAREILANSGTQFDPDLAEIFVNKVLPKLDLKNEITGE